MDIASVLIFFWLRPWQCAYYGKGIGSSCHGVIMIMVSVTAVTLVVKNAMAIEMENSGVSTGIHVHALRSCV